MFIECNLTEANFSKLAIDELEDDDDLVRETNAPVSTECLTGIAQLEDLARNRRTIITRCKFDQVVLRLLFFGFFPPFLFLLVLSLLVVCFFFWFFFWYFCSFFCA